MDCLALSATALEPTSGPRNIVPPSQLSTEPQGLSDKDPYDLSLVLAKGVKRDSVPVPQAVKTSYAADLVTFSLSLFEHWPPASLPLGRFPLNCQWSKSDGTFPDPDARFIYVCLRIEGPCLGPTAVPTSPFEWTLPNVQKIPQYRMSTLQW
ncbi:hypothetical protein SprV_0100056400 [Sparganum proliferum]